MNILFEIFMLAVGFVLLIKGADWFVEGASSIAERFGIPQLVIGLTIVAMGTSAPEAAVSIASAFKGTADIAVGNVLGSNILNILIILGITAVITKVPVQKSTVKYEIPFVLFISILMGVLGFFGNSLSRLDGIILWVFFIAYFIYLVKMAKADQAAGLATDGLTVDTIVPQAENTDRANSLAKSIVATVVGVAVIILGSDVAVDSATVIAETLGMSERFIGLTVVALGTSLPELVTSITAALKGKTDIAIGNIVGSNIFNILFVLGTAALVIPLDYASSFMFDTVVASLAVVMLFVSVLRKKMLGRAAGIIMLIAYAAYFCYII